MEGIERIKKEEEESRENEVEALPNRDRDHSLRHFLVLCSSCNHRLVLFFILLVCGFYFVFQILFH